MMKHVLSYEQTWKKALSQQDQYLIESIFEGTALPKEGEVQFTPVRAAYNHRNDLIATALVHNSKNTPFPIYELSLIYKENDEQIAGHVFTIPRLVIPPYTAMPWSFLFPKEAQYKKATFKEWGITAQ